MSFPSALSTNTSTHNRKTENLEALKQTSLDANLGYGKEGGQPGDIWRYEWASNGERQDFRSGGELVNSVVDYLREALAPPHGDQRLLRLLVRNQEQDCQTHQEDEGKQSYFYFA